MSPGQALDSPVFLFYLALALTLLVLGGLVLAGLGWGLGKNVGHAWKAYGGWLLIVPVLLMVYFLGRETVIVFLAVVAIIAFREFARVSALRYDGLLGGSVYLGIVAVALASLVTDPTSGQPGWYGLFMVLPVFVTAVIVAMPVVRNRVDNELSRVALAAFGFVYFGWMFGHLSFLANSAFAYSYLGFLVAAVELNDIAAYISGKCFGRRLLRSNISPKKTWEGATGALLASLLLPWALRFTFPHFEPLDCLVVGLIVGIGGQLGDLVVSVFKRDLRIKDMGTSIPGHGGFLDRIDSLIYTAPLFFHYIRCRFDLTPGPQ
jgi:phosphatidate cytidylyltransferase